MNLSESEEDIIIKRIEVISYYVALIGNISLLSLGIIILVGEGPAKHNDINNTTIGVFLIVFSMTCINTFFLYISTLILLSIITYSFNYIVNQANIIFRKRVHNISLDHRSSYISIV